MVQDDAAKHAMDAVVEQVRTPGSPLYRHRVAIRSVEPHGKGGWLIRIGDRTDGSVVCIVDLPVHGALGTRENLRLVRCAPPSPHAGETTPRA